MQRSHRGADGSQRGPETSQPTQHRQQSHTETEAGVSHLHALLSFLLQPHSMMVTAKRVLATGLSSSH